MKGTYEDYIVQRTLDAAKYTIENKSTIRETANYIGVSKSTIHKDLNDRLLKINPQLYHLVHEVIEENTKERHLRGGIATRQMYEQLRESNGQNW